MENIWIIIIISCMIGFTNSAKIILKVNSSNYIEGTAAELSCLFPPSVKGKLQWVNTDNILKTKLRCNLVNVCDTYDGYQLTRIGNNITLVIDEVNRLAYRWECSTLFATYTEIAVLNITANPKLDLTLTGNNLVYQIKTSCSSIPMNVTCLLNNKEPLEIKDIEWKLCPRPVLSYFYGIIKLSQPGTVVCTVRRGDDSYIQTSQAVRTYMHYIGAVVLAIGFFFIALIIIPGLRACYEKCSKDGCHCKDTWGCIHGFLTEKWVRTGCNQGSFCGFGMSFIFFGIAILAYDHVFEFSVVFMVFGSIMCLLAIYCLFFMKKSEYKATSCIAKST